MPTSPVQLYFDRQHCPDYGSLVLKYGKLAFASPARSTVPLLALLKDDYPLFDRTISQCVPAATAADLHLEFKVKSLRGLGKASHTDVMTLNASRAVAVETKWTEPRSATIGDIDKLTKNKQAVLEGWLDLLRPHAAKLLHAQEFSGVVYQMLHRAASACYSERAPALVYILFHPAPGKNDHPSHYATDLTHLYQVLGKPAGFSFTLIEFPVDATEAFVKIKDLKKGLSDTDRAVRDALVTSSLFDFGKPVIRRIGEGT